MKVVDQINKDLNELGNVYAAGNAHGIPNSTGHYELDNARVLPPIEINEQTPLFLRNLAKILEKYF